MHGGERNRAKYAQFSQRLSAVQRLHKVPQLHGRKFTEPVLNLPLGPLQKDPAGGAVPLAAHKMQPSAHRPDAASRGAGHPRATALRVGLHLDVDLPARVATLELAHVLGAVLAREGGAHRVDRRSLRDSLTVAGGRAVVERLTGIQYAAPLIPAS